jgi:hypothetical protein
MNLMHPGGLTAGGVRGTRVGDVRNSEIDRKILMGTFSGVEPVGMDPEPEPTAVWLEEHQR